MLNTILEALRARRSNVLERGASAVEYGLLVAGIAALVVVAIFALGPVIKEAFTDTCSEMTKTGSTLTDAKCTTP